MLGCLVFLPAPNRSFKCIALAADFHQIFVEQWRLRRVRTDVLRGHTLCPKLVGTD